MVFMAQERRYQLQSEEANQQIQAMLEGLQIPGDSRLLYAQLLTTVLKMYEDGADLGDLKIANSTLKELRYAFKVFSLYRDHPESDSVRFGAYAAGHHPFPSKPSVLPRTW